MFTGLIEEIATLVDTQPFSGGRRLRVRAADAARQLAPGESVALSGVCLTVESCEAERGEFTVSAIAETLRRTTIAGWRRGSRVHLERALAVSARLGGHLVQGHIDGVGRVTRAALTRGGFTLAVALPAPLRRYVVSQGSIALDGVSLTVAGLAGTVCRVGIIPETLRRTLIGTYRPGRAVNIEVDILAKYAAALLGGQTGGERRTEWQ